MSMMCVCLDFQISCVFIVFWSQIFLSWFWSYFLLFLQIEQERISDQDQTPVIFRKYLTTIQWSETRYAECQLVKYDWAQAWWTLVKSDKILAHNLLTLSAPQFGSVFAVCKWLVCNRSCYSTRLVTEESLKS